MQDEDRGIAFLAYSSQDNRVMHISALTPDYAHVTSTYTKILSGLSREAPAMCKFGDLYLMATSGCSGWEPNQLEVFWSRSAFTQGLGEGMGGWGGGWRRLHCLWGSPLLLHFVSDCCCLDDTVSAYHADCL